ncbi:DUF6508 domain-containing protein [Methanosphaera sp. BMS]|uniref:DUF6508 domain-containing protein n=1 Tax=Methanosphaera sp. BMS TaxID=1789762 RepID=UPI000DC1ED56|nr:DUF6508 domain-containing protein [Methanosphaera sp. BMS]AWX31862.1 hypothetical protein AW729_01590 [Methanosphaera sp. BMS]
MEPEYNRKTEFTKEELIEILDSFLEYKPVFDRRVSGEDSSWKVDETRYDTDASTHRYIGYDYTYVKAAWDVRNVVYDYRIEDKENIPNFKIICEKYGVHDVKGASEKKLDFLEIVTIITYIDRADRHSDGGWYEHRVEDGTFYNLLCRLEDIRDDL